MRRFSVGSPTPQKTKTLAEEMEKLRFFLLSLALLLVPRTATAQPECDPFCTCIGEQADCSARLAFDFRFTEIPVVPPTTTTLVLTNNEIAELPSGAFSHLPVLEELLLDNNQISSVSSEFFDSLPNLRRLVLDGNPLQELSTAAVFSNLTSLQELSIQRTPLGELQGSVFSGLSALTNLLLDENELVSLSTNFLGDLPSLILLSLTGNSLETLPDGFLDGAPVANLQLDLQDNPWSCDCRLEWLAISVATNPDLISTDEAECQWPASLDGSPLRTLDSSDYQCYAPSITQQPQNDSILTDAPYTLEVIVDGAPFPEVVWNRDGETVEYTENVFVSGYDASLVFTTVTNNDGGVYSVSLSNNDRSEESISITLSVTEATCVDGELTQSHETDVDCGGQYCIPCSMGNKCQVDRDCEGELVCLYRHQLPSGLLYMSPKDPEANTCANSTVPQTRLESLFSTISSNLPFTVAGNSSIQEIEVSFHSFITETLSIPSESLEVVSVNTVGRRISPLLQFEARIVQNCENALANLNNHIDSGLLKATVKTAEGQGNVCYNIRLNL